jgi:RimJ/RimL family protein N-acetyltransferase
MTELPRDRIAGDGIVLREPIDADIDDVVAACNDAEIVRFLDMIPNPYADGDARDWLYTNVPANRERGGASFAIADPDTDRLLGSISANGSRLGGYATSVGYWMAPWARGRGLATAATRALVSWLFGHGFGRIELITDVANMASQRVAVASGFRHEGIRRSGLTRRGDVRADAVVWSRLAADDDTPAPRLLPDLPGGRLTDGVVTLRPAGPDDAADLLALRQLPDIVARSARGRVPTPEQMADYCERVGYRWLIGDRATLTLRAATTSAFIGEAGIFALEATGQARIGYDVRPEWRGRGTATRAVRLIGEWAFEQAGLHRLSAGTEPDNVASQRVLTKAAFVREGYERSRLPALAGGNRRDLIEYALIRA